MWQVTKSTCLCPLPHTSHTDPFWFLSFPLTWPRGLFQHFAPSAWHFTSQKDLCCFRHGKCALLCSARSYKSGFSRRDSEFRFLLFGLTFLWALQSVLYIEGSIRVIRHLPSCPGLCSLAGTWAVVWSTWTVSAPSLTNLGQTTEGLQTSATTFVKWADWMRSMVSRLHSEEVL